MKPLIRQVLVVAAGTLLAAAFLGVIRTVDPGMDWPTALMGAALVMGVVLALGTPSAEDREDREA